ncbi:unnamed protein product [Parajaminaea phylloscopi]
MASDPPPPLSSAPAQPPTSPTTAAVEHECQPVKVEAVLRSPLTEPAQICSDDDKENAGACSQQRPPAQREHLSQKQPAAQPTRARSIQGDGDEDDGLFDALATPPLSQNPPRGPSKGTESRLPSSGQSRDHRSDNGLPSRRSIGSPQQRSRFSGATSAASPADQLDEKPVAELNAMLMANLQRKDHINEQLIQVMEGTAPPGTDLAWLQSSRAFLTSRIDGLKAALATRGRASFPPPSQLAAPLLLPGLASRSPSPVRPGPQSETLQHTSPEPAAPASASTAPTSVSRSALADAIVLFSPSPSPSRSRKQPSAPLRPQAGTAAPKDVPQKGDGGQSPQVYDRQAGRPAAQAELPSCSKRPAALATAQADPMGEEDEFADLDESFFDAGDEVLGTEVHASSNRGTTEQSRGIAYPGGGALDAAVSAEQTRPGSRGKSPARVNPTDHLSRASGESATPPSKDKATFRDQMNYVWSRDVAKALRRTFGLREFRSNQLEAINSTLNGQDVFCLMPTGGGKSLCYQLPAVIDSGRTQGVTVVISPLLSLIHDQVRHLLDLTVPALMLTGDMQGPKREFAITELFSKDPTTRLLYVTPEFVGRSRQAMDIFTYLSRKQKLARFVIDEAHCVSQWGHDFRPDYQTLGKLRQEFPGIPVMAMTATANHRVKADVVASLGIKGCKVLEQSFNRGNLHYEVREKNQKTVVADIAKFIQSSHKGQCGIVYCLSRRACEEVADRLTRDHGLQAQHYHAALSKQDRLAIQESWQAGEFRIIVATIAFGMGIDKGDVRFVVHHTLPQSLEGYYQETGRAGRDGKSSTCVLYFNYKDTNVIKRMIDDGEGTTEQKEQQHANLRRVVQYCMNRNDCRRAQVLQYFGEVFPPEACHHTCDNCCKSAREQAEIQDVTVQARQAAELVRDLTRRSSSSKGGHTMLHFVDVFRGSQSRSVRDKGHHQHKFAGAGSSLNRGDVERLFQHLTIREIFNERSEVNAMGFANAYLELGPAATDLFEGKTRIELSVQKSSGVLTTSTVRPNSSAASRKKAVVAVRDGPTLVDEDFEAPPVDEWDISHIDLSPSPEQRRAVAPPAAVLPHGHRGILARSESFETLHPRGMRSSRPAAAASRSASSNQLVLDNDVADEDFEPGQRSIPSGSRAAVPRVNPRGHLASPTKRPSDPSDDLYSALVTRRDSVARQRGVVKAAVFDDVTLDRMASNCPQGIADFVALRGVGDEKYEAFGREFLQMCKDFRARGGMGPKRPAAQPIDLEKYTCKPQQTASDLSPADHVDGSLRVGVNRKGRMSDQGAIGNARGTGRPGGGLTRSATSGRGSGMFRPSGRRPAI